MITSLSEKEKVLQFKEAGANYYLLKPFENDKFDQTLLENICASWPAREKGVTHGMSELQNHQRRREAILHPRVGLPLGALCKRCGKWAKPRTNSAAIAGPPFSHRPMNIYSPIPPRRVWSNNMHSMKFEELLSLRKKARQDEAASERVTQHDIDSIFS